MKTTILIILVGIFSVFGQHKRPNILFIVADDMGAWTIGSSGNPNSYTPELDKLAKSGVLFTNAFSVSAVCSPSRASLISGRYPSETGVLDVIWQDQKTGMDTTLTLWPELFQGAGYQTALVGKWHLGEYNESFFPESRGYSKFSGFLHGGLLSRSPTVRIEGRDTIFKDKYTADVMADLTMSYINKFKGNPWVISLHFWAPHANTRFPKGYSPPYNDRSWLPLKEEDQEYWNSLELVLPEPNFPNLDRKRNERMMREYLSSVKSLDRNVGRVMDYLQSLGMDRNTIIIFTSDHGYMMGEHGLWHKGNGRWLTLNQSDPSGSYTDNRPNMFDRSMRVPFIVKWSGTASENSRISQTITLLDCYPTLLEMAGIEQPANLMLRGRSFVPLIKDTWNNWDNVFYGQYKSMRCIQTSEWKYIIHFDDLTHNELYNLSNDPQEKYNLIESIDPNLNSIKEELKGLLIAKMNEINDSIVKKQI